MLTYLQGVGDEADRSRVDEDVVVLLAQMGEDDIQRRAGDELRGVGRNGTGQQQVEVVVDAGRQDLILHLLPGGIVVGEQRGDAVLVVVNLEELCQTRLTDVETNEDGLLA